MHIPLLRKKSRANYDDTPFPGCCSLSYYEEESTHSVETTIILPVCTDMLLDAIRYTVYPPSVTEQSKPRMSSLILPVFGLVY